MSEETTKEKSRSSNKLLIIGIVVVVLLVGGGVAVLLLSGALGGKGGTQKRAQGPRGNPESRVLGKTISMDTLIVNLNEPGGTRYLKVKFQLEISHDTVEEEMVKKKIPIKDSLLMYLASLTLTETQSVDAKVKIKVNVKSRINKELASGRVLRVFFEEFVIQ